MINACKSVAQAHTVVGPPLTTNLCEQNHSVFVSVSVFSQLLTYCPPVRYSLSTVARAAACLW